MNTLFILYIYSVVALGHPDKTHGAKEWVERGTYASQQHCEKAGKELRGAYKCIDSGIPVDTKWVK